MPTSALFIASYEPVKVSIDPLAGFSFDDLDFSVMPGPQAGSVSQSKDASFDPSNPTVLLGAGPTPGVGYTLVAKVRSTGTIVATGTFSVTETLAVSAEGPSRWYWNTSGDSVEMSPYWSNLAPQNFGVSPQTGIKKCAVIFLQTSNAVPWDFQQTLADWQAILRDGFSGPNGSESTAKYFKEASYFGPNGGLDMVFDFYGPFTLTPTGGAYVDTAGLARPGTHQRYAAAADGQVDFLQYQHAFFVVNLGVPTLAVGTIGTIAIKIFDGPLNSADHHIGSVAMPTPYISRPDGTAAHEISHNFGLNTLRWMRDHWNLARWPAMSSGLRWNFLKVATSALSRSAVVA